MGEAWLTRFMMGAGLSVLSFCAVLLLATAWMAMAFPHALEGVAVLKSGTPNYLRNFLEIFSFVSTGIVIPLAGFLAFIVGYRQLDELRRSREGEEKLRIASMYLEVNSRYNAETMREARRTLKLLRDDYAKFGPPGQPPDAYMAAKFIRWSAAPLQSQHYRRYNECMRIVEFWEEIAVLIRRDYIDRDIIFDFLLGAIKYAEENFAAYMRVQRELYHSETLYENAFWLMREARLFEPPKRRV